MTEKEYLDQLRSHLSSSLPSAEVEEIVQDYKFHFEGAKESGKSTESVIASLGNPRSLARLHIAENLLAGTKDQQGNAKLRNLFTAVLILLALAPFNLFLLAGPFLVIFVVLLSGWTVILSTLVALIFGAAQFLFVTRGPLPDFFGTASITFWALAGISFSFVVSFIWGALSWMCVKGLSQFVRWNINLVLQKARGEK